MNLSLFLFDMKQPIKKCIKNKCVRKKTQNKKNIILDGSSLETFFRENILDKLGINYIQQFEAKSIGRFYDFMINDRVLIEIDGSYWHSDPRLYESPINAIQKRNKRVDKIKDDWALINGYKLIRFWEKDILNDTENIKKILIEKLQIQNKVILLEKSKKNGSFFMKKN